MMVDNVLSNNNLEWYFLNNNWINDNLIRCDKKQIKLRWKEFSLSVCLPLNGIHLMLIKSVPHVYLREGVSGGLVFECTPQAYSCLNSGFSFS